MLFFFPVQRLQKTGHIFPKNAHGIHSFLIILNVPGHLTISQWPVAGTYYKHFLQQEEMIHGIQRVDRAAAPGADAMMVTPRDIDAVIDRGAKTLSFSINAALQPQLSLEDIVYLTS